MRNIELQATAEEMEAQKQEFKQQIFPILRTSVWSLILVVILIELLQFWQSELDEYSILVIWSIPVVFPTMFLLLSYGFSIIKPVYVFDHKGLRNKNGHHTDKIVWKRVKSWSIEQEDKFLIAKFELNLKGHKIMRFHKSHGKDALESLIKRFIQNSR